MNTQTALSSMRFFLIISFLIPFIGACDQEQMSPEQQEEYSSYQAYEVPPPPQKEEEETTQPDVSTQKVTRKLIKEGTFSFETNDLSATRKNIDSAILRFGGYLSKDQSNTYGNRVEQTLVVRVPADRFDSLVAAISQGVSAFDEKEIRVKDVTEEFVDVSARLTARKELEARYISLLKQAKTVTEILEIEEQLGEVREKIETMEGRLRFLKDRVGYSTLLLKFYQTTTYTKELGFGSRLAEGFSDGWDGLKGFFIGLVTVWPLWLIAGLLFWGIRRVRRSLRKKK